MKLINLKGYLDKTLKIKKYKKDEKNGIIVSGKKNISKIGISVNPTFEVIKKAKKAKVDFLLTHHGGWKKFDQDLLIKKKNMLKSAGISLYVAHASLDCAKGIGMSVALAEALGVKVDNRFCYYYAGYAGAIGNIQPISFNSFKKRVSSRLNTKLRAWKNNNKKVKRVGIVTGGGPRTVWMKQARDLGADTYLTGESSMFGIIYAKETGLNVISATHYGTERHGLIALGKQLKNEFIELKIVEISDRIKEC